MSPRLRSRDNSKKTKRPGRIDKELKKFRATEPSDDACRNLLSAVVLQAVRDYQIAPSRCHVSERLEGLKLWKAEATAWIFGKPADKKTSRLKFEDCCDLLDLDLGDVRKRLKEGVA